MCFVSLQISRVEREVCKFNTISLNRKISKNDIRDVRSTDDFLTFKFFGDFADPVDFADFADFAFSADPADFADSALSLSGKSFFLLAK